MENILKLMVKEESAELRSLIFEKIGFLCYFNQFTHKYSICITSIFKNISDIIFKQMENTLNQNKKFLKFFKDITSAYQRFSTDLIGTSTVLSNFKDQILSDNINTMIGKTQESLSDNFLNFSNVLTQKIITKGPFLKIAEFFKRLHTIKKNVSKEICNANSKREKLDKIFNSKYQHLFNQFKYFYQNNIKSSSLVILNQDFFLIEMDLLNNFNIVLQSTVELLNNFKSQLELIRILISDYSLLIKEIFQIYIDENKKIFSGSANINFDDVEKLFGSINQCETNFTPNKILKNEAEIKSINELLLAYQTELLKYNIVIKDELIYNDDNFRIEKFISIDQLMDMLIKLNPQKFNINNSELTDHQFELKRDPGIFKSWKTCFLVLTKQGNAILFDEQILYENYLNFMNIQKIKFKPKEDKNNPYRFEISETKKGFIFNKNVNFILDAITKEKYEEISQLIGSNRDIKESDSTIQQKVEEGDIEKVEEIQDQEKN